LEIKKNQTQQKEKSQPN